MSNDGGIVNVFEKSILELINVKNCLYHFYSSYPNYHCLLPEVFSLINFIILTLLCMYVSKP